MCPRTGRPTSDPKKDQFKIRLTESQREKLEYCAEKTGRTKTEIITRGIDKVYEELKQNN